MDLGQLTATLGIDSAPLRKAEGDLRAFGSTADSTFSKAISTAAAYAAAVLSIAAAYRVLSDVASVGMKVETMGVVMNQIGKNVGMSTQALQYFKKEVESTGVTGMEAMSALGKAMSLGLNLNQMKEFTTRVRDVAVGARDAAGNMMNTSQTVNAVMHGIQSGQVEVLRNLGVTVRGTEEVYKAYAKAIGKTKEELNDAQKAQAMFNEFMRASATLAGSAAAADQTVGKQLASMARYSEEAKVALWGVFQPGMMAAVQGMTKGFQDLRKWAEENSVALSSMGVKIGEFVTSAISAAGSMASWAVANTELLKGLAELYILGKIVSWAASAGIALQSFIQILITTGNQLITLRTLASGPWPAIIITAVALGIATAVTSLRNLAEQYLVTKGIIEGNRMAQPHGYVVPGEVISEGGKKPLDLEGRNKFLADAAKQTESQARLNTELGKEITARSAILKLTIPVGNIIEQGALTTKMMADRTLAAKSKAEADAAAALALAKLGGAGKEAKGGKGEDAEINRLNSLFDTLTKSIAGLSGGKFAEIEANYNKTIEQIHKKTSDRVTSITELEVLAAKEKNLKLEKAEEEYQLKIANMAGDPFRVLQAEYDKDIRAWGNTEEKKAAIWEGYNRKWVAAEIGIQMEIANIGKSYIDTMAGLSPILTDQLALKQKSLEIENELALAAIEKTLAEKPYLEHLRQEMVAQQALIKQAKEYALEREKWQTQGIMGGAKMWAMERTNEMSTRTAKTVQEDLKGLEGWISTSLSTGFFTALKGTHAEFNKFFRGLGDTFVKTIFDKLTKTLTHTLFDFLAKGLSKLSASLLGDAAGGLFGGAGKFAGSTASGAIGNIGGGLVADSPQVLATTANTSALIANTAAILGGTAVEGAAIVSQGLLTAAEISGTAASMADIAISTADIAAEGALVGATVALTSAMIANTVSNVVDSIIPFHSGGLIYAHRGYPPRRPGEVDIRALEGERVLSIPQNRDYEAGMRAAGGRPGENGGGATHVHYHDNRVVNAIDAQGVEAVLQKHGRALVKIIDREVGKRGRRL